jgi:hypothetical protein
MFLLYANLYASSLVFHKRVTASCHLHWQQKIAGVADAVHCEKGLVIFPSPTRESLVSDIPAWYGKIDNLFYSVPAANLLAISALSAQTHHTENRLLQFIQ